MVLSLNSETSSNELASRNSIDVKVTDGPELGNKDLHAGNTTNIDGKTQAMNDVAPRESVEHSDLILKMLQNETPGCTCKKSKCLKLYCQCFAASALCDKEKCKCDTCKNDVSRETEIMRARSNVLYRNPRAFEGKFTNNHPAPTTRKLPCIRRNFSAMRNTVGPSPYPNQPLSHDPSLIHLTGLQGNASIPTLHERSSIENFSQLTVPPHGRPGNGATMAEASLSHKSGCKCRKSFCVKKYCECFQNGVKCGSNCRCVDCRNQNENQHGNFSEVTNISMKMNQRDFMAQPTLIGMAMPNSHGMMDMGYGHFHGQQYRHMSDVFPTQALKPAVYPIQERRHLVSFDNTDGGSMMRPNEMYDRRRTQMVLAAADASDYVRNSHIYIHHKNDFDGAYSKNGVKPTSSTQDSMALMAALAMTELAGISKSASATEQPTNQSGAKENTTTKKRNHEGENDRPLTLLKKSRSESGANDDFSNALELATVSKSLSNLSNVPSPSNSPMSMHSSSDGDENNAPTKNTTFPIQMAVAAAMEQKAQMTFGPPKEDVSVSLTTTKLPQSLTFRKICSKCGRARNEHGEIGFGNNCAFEDCAKCGASLLDHEKVGVRMGFYCSLTERGSASVKPGMADCYMKKIHEMATMAKLKKDLITSQYNQSNREPDKVVFDVDAVH